MFKLVNLAIKGIYSLVRFLLVGTLPPRSQSLRAILSSMNTKLESIQRKQYYDHPGTHDYSKPPGEDQPAGAEPVVPDPFAQAFPAQANSMPKTGDPVIQ